MAADAEAPTQMMLPALDRTQLVPQVPDVPPETRRLDAVPEQAPAPDEDFTEATTHGTRIRGTKRSVIAAAVVFVVAMGGITGFELLSGHDLNGGKGTTVGGAVTGGGSKKSTPSSPDPGPSDTSNPSPTPSGSDDGRSEGSSSSSSPGTSKGDGSDSTPDPSPSPSTSDGGTPTPTPTPTLSGSSSASPQNNGDAGTESTPGN